MSQNAEYVFTGNAAQLLAEYQKLEKAKDRDIAKLKAQMRASKESANENAKLARDIEQAWQKARTPAEAYNATLGRYKKALQEGMISQAQFNRLRDVELQKLKDNKLALDRKAESDRKAAMAQNQSRSSADMLTSSFMAQAAGLLSVTAGIRKVIEEQRKYREEAEATTLTVDELNRAFAVQAGLDEVQSIEARGKILQVAKDNKVSPERSFLASTQLVSSGFDAPHETGTLDVFLKAMASGNLGKEDPVALAKATGQFMESFGMEKNAANLEDVMVRVRGLFKGTDVQVSDLSDFSKAAPVFAEWNVSLEDTLSMLTSLRKTMEPGEAATFSRKIATTVSTISGSDDKTVALAGLGLTPDEVDLVGETLPQVLDKLKFAVENTAEEQRAPLLKKIFEEATVSPLLTALRNVDNFGKFANMQRDAAGFEQGWRTAQAGPNAGLQELRTDKMIIELQSEVRQSRDALSLQLIENARAEQQQRANITGAGFGERSGLTIGNLAEDIRILVNQLGGGTRFETLTTGEQLKIKGMIPDIGATAGPKEAAKPDGAKDAVNLERIARAAERTADAVANPGTKLPGTNPSNQTNRVRP